MLASIKGPDVTKITAFQPLRATEQTFAGIQVNASQNLIHPGVVMGRQTSYRKTADVLRKTIQQLEDDPTIDTRGTAFVDLKCNLLNRIIELETDKARAEAVIHLVNTDSPDAAGSSKEQKTSDSAIA